MSRITRSALAVAIGTIAVGGFVPPTAIGEPTPPPARGTVQRLAGAISEKLTVIARRRLDTSFGCVQVRDAQSHDPRVRLLITNAHKRRVARRSVRDAVAAVLAPLKGRRVTLPHRSIHVIDRRYSERIMSRIADRLTTGAHAWIGTPGVSVIPGITRLPQDELPHCAPVTIELEPGHPSDQLTWAQDAQRRYGADRVSIVRRSDGGPPLAPR
jgi:hypothetical protein